LKKRRTRTEEEKELKELEKLRKMYDKMEESNPFKTRKQKDTEKMSSA